MGYKKKEKSIMTPKILACRTHNRKCGGGVTEMGKPIGHANLQKIHEFDFGHVNVEMPIIHPSSEAN